MIGRMVVGVSARVTDIEEAFVGHLSHFGRWPYGRLADDPGTSLRRAPTSFNAVGLAPCEEPPRVLRRLPRTALRETP